MASDRGGPVVSEGSGGDRVVRRRWFVAQGIGAVATAVLASCKAPDSSLSGAWLAERQRVLDWPANHLDNHILEADLLRLRERLVCDRDLALKLLEMSGAVGAAVDLRAEALRCLAYIMPWQASEVRRLAMEKLVAAYDDDETGPLSLLVFATGRVGAEEPEECLLATVRGKGDQEHGAVEAWAAARVLIARGQRARQRALVAIEESDLGRNMHSSVETEGSRWRDVPWDEVVEFSHLVIAGDHGDMPHGLLEKALVEVLRRSPDRRQSIALAKLCEREAWSAEVIGAMAKLLSARTSVAVKKECLLALAKVPWQEWTHCIDTTLRAVARLEQDSDHDVATLARDLMARLQGLQAGPARCGKLVLSGNSGDANWPRNGVWELACGLFADSGVAAGAEEADRWYEVR